GGSRGEADGDEAHLAELAHRPSGADRALHDDSEQARVREDESDLLGPERHSVPGQPSLREERESAHEDGEGEGVEEELPEQAAEDGSSEVRTVEPPVEDAQALATRRDRRLFLGGEGGRGLLGLRMRRDARQEERGSEDARQGQRGGAKDRNLEAEVRGEESGDSGTDEEADSEGDADERERTRTLLRRRDVGDVRLRDGEITRGDPVDGAGEED